MFLISYWPENSRLINLEPSPPPLPHRGKPSCSAVDNPPPFGLPPQRRCFKCPLTQFTHTYVKWMWIVKLVERLHALNTFQNPFQTTTIEKYYD